MTKFIIIAVLGVSMLTGCTYHWQVYPGPRLPKQETAIIKETNTTRFLRIDKAKPAWNPFPFCRRVARVLPGPHEVEVAVGPPSYEEPILWFLFTSRYTGRREHVTIDATAGGTYRVHFDNDNDAVWVEDSRSP